MKISFSVARDLIKRADEIFAEGYDKVSVKGTLVFRPEAYIYGKEYFYISVMEKGVWIVLFASIVDNAEVIQTENVLTFLDDTGESFSLVLFTLTPLTK
jgi:hypothetical protein